MKKYFAKKELSDEDWKTQLAKGYENIPEGTELNVVGSISNFYGKFATVLYRGVSYYIKWEYIDVVNTEENKE